MSKHERFTTAVNDSTGDLIKTKPSNQQAYADNWERIFGKKKDVSASETSLLGLGTKLGLGYGDGLEYQNMVREGILSQPDFAEELLPEGMIGDEE